MAVYPHRVVIVVPVANQSTADSIAAGMDSSSGGNRTFLNLQLSPSGVAPATHLACDTLMEQDKRDALPGYSSVLGTSGQAWNVETGEVLLPNASAWTASNCAGWTGQQCFDVLGLKPIDQ